MNSPASLEWYKSKSQSEKTKNILLGGDLCPIRGCESQINAGEAIFSPELMDSFKDNDLFVVNLEAPLCDDLPSEGPTGLRASRVLAEKLKRFNIGLACLANNHLRDFGDEGVLQTLRALDSVGIPHSGAGENLDEAQKMKIVDLNGFKLGIWALAEREQNVASDSRPGTSWFHPEVNVHEIPKLREQVDFLLLFVHAGHEFMLTPSPRIRTAYRDFISAGADAVIAHHPHVVQGVEEYKNGWIVYSLGNLLFDSDYVFKHEHSRLGFLVRLAIGEHEIHKLELIPYRIEESLYVSALKTPELNEFKSLMIDISENLHDEVKFRDEWEKNIKHRWFDDYEPIYRSFSKSIFEDKDPYFSRVVNNMFTCPTHHEMMDSVSRFILPRVEGNSD